MLELFRGVALIAATLTTGLMAGLYWAFAYAVMPGLGRGDDRTFVIAMQRMNESILNGWFFLCFLGSLAFSGLAAILHIGESVLPWAVAAFVLYGAGFVSTMTVNVPLNNAISAAGDPDGTADLAAVRTGFEAPWVRWNVVRGALTTGAFGSLAWALVIFGRVTG